jgi:hypothetical protein
MKNKNTWYEILDIDKFVEATRILVFDAFGKNRDYEVEGLAITIDSLKPEERLELDSVLTQQECMVISKDFIQQRTKQNTKRYVISEKKYMAMIESLNERLVSNMLRNLTKIGLLETAYDSNLNDFVFWIKDQDNENKDKNS